MCSISRDDDLLIFAERMFDKQAAPGTHSGCNLTCSEISSWLIILELRLRMTKQQGPTDEFSLFCSILDQMDLNEVNLWNYVDRRLWFEEI